MSVRETEKKQRNEEKKIHSFISAYVLEERKKDGREREGGSGRVEREKGGRK